ncbi:MAG: transposase [Oscillatoriaceae cyanobacterium Prado104]|nr:transposase [Oscillatoriaceae cyanobacterium Prado104]
MEHVLTLVCKLQLTTEQGAKIDALLGAFAEACNLTNRIVKPSVKSKTTIQGLVYQTLREQFGLSANQAVRVCARVGANRKTATAKNKPVKAFEPASADYDARIFSFREQDWTVSLTLLGCRERIKLVIGNYQQGKLKGRKPTSAQLCLHRDGQYYIHIQLKNAVIYPQFLRKSEKRLKKAQRRLSKKFVKGAKPQSQNYHKARKRLGKVHLKVQRQRKDWAIKQARCVVHSNDVVVYEDLKIANMVKNHHLAKSISDAGWYQYTQWLDYYGKIWDKAVVAVSPNYTSQDCSNCGHRVKKSLSTRTHSCPNCKIEICRDTNAALNILHKGLNVLGVEWNKHSTSGQEESGSQDRKHGEKIATAVDKQFDSVSKLL